jgi:hypothetical protein
MYWAKELPCDPGPYFLDDCGEISMVEIFITQNGPKYFEFGTNNIVECCDLHDPLWLGPIKHEDIINLWRSFEEKA